MKYFILPLCLVILLLSGCVLEQDIHFNKDFSGEYALKIDMSAFVALENENAPADSSMQLTSEDFAQLENAIRAIPGISNVRSSVANGVYNIVYSFSDVESLTNAGNLSGAETGGFIQLHRSGKKLIISLMPPPESEEKMTDEEIESMEEMVEFRYNLRFDAPISKVKSKIATYNKESNSVHLKFGMKEFFSAKDGLKTVIRFK